MNEIISILINEAMSGYVKIGRTTNEGIMKLLAASREVSPDFVIPDLIRNPVPLRETYPRQAAGY